MIDLVSRRGLRSRRAFTLVEVTLALGIVAFAVVSILGVMPVALDNQRQSVDEGRASAVANTLLASLRGQPFRDVRYLDSQYDADGKPQGTGLDLSKVAPSVGSTSAVSLYAKFLDPAAGLIVTGNANSDQRRLCLLDFTNPMKLTADYSVALNFSWPAGVTAVSGRVVAVQVEVVVTPLHRTQTVYRFVSTVTARTS